MVGLIPLFAVRGAGRGRRSTQLPGFRKRMEWFLDEPPGPGAAHRVHGAATAATARPHRLLAIPSRERLERVLRYLLDENEFLSPLRHPLAVARAHATHPFVLRRRRRRASRRLRARRVEHRPVRRQLELARADLVPGELPADRGARALPPLLRRRRCTVECPTGSGQLHEPARGGAGARARGWRGCSCPTRRAGGPATATTARYADDPHWRDLRAVPRVLPRRHRPRPRREPPDRLDGAGASAASRTWRARRAGAGDGAASRAPDAGRLAGSRPMTGPRSHSTTPPNGSRPTASAASPRARGGLRTRRYHALLLAATTPPTGRMVLVNGLDAGSTHDGADGVAPRRYLTRQRYAPDVVAPAARRGARVVRERAVAHLDLPARPTARGSSTSCSFRAGQPARGAALAARSAAAAGALAVRPLLSGRDSHALHHENPAFRFDRARSSRSA